MPGSGSDSDPRNGEACVLVLGASGVGKSTLLGALYTAADDRLQCAQPEMRHRLRQLAEAHGARRAPPATVEFLQYYFRLRLGPDTQTEGCTVIDSPGAVWLRGLAFAEEKHGELLIDLLQEQTAVIVCVSALPVDETGTAVVCQAFTELVRRGRLPKKSRILFFPTKTSYPDANLNALKTGSAGALLELVARGRPVGVFAKAPQTVNDEAPSALEAFRYAITGESSRVEVYQSSQRARPASLRPSPSAPKPAAIVEDDKFDHDVVPVGRPTSARQRMRALRAVVALLLVALPGLFLAGKCSDARAPVVDRANVAIRLQFVVGSNPVTGGSQISFQVDSDVKGLPEGTQLAADEHAQLAGPGGMIDVTLLGDSAASIQNGVHTRRGRLIIPKGTLGQHQLRYTLRERLAGDQGAAIEQTATIPLVVTPAATDSGLPRVAPATELGGGRRRGSR